MKQIFMKRFLIAGVALLVVPASLLAQTGQGGVYQKEKNKKDVDQIIINRVASDDKKGDEKTVIEIQGDKITINGKEVKGDNTVKVGDVTVQRNKLKNLDSYVSIPGGQGWTMSTDALSLFNEDENRAMLGVNTETDDKGAKIVSLVAGGAAEKAGLKKGDIITKIDKEKISESNAITEVIRDRKPGDKVSVTVLRDGKEQTINAELGKWKGVRMNSVFTPGREFYKELNPVFEGDNFRVMSPSIAEIEGLRNHSFVFGGAPRLGLSVQDTDEGKGVKVIEINEEGNAAKAGLKKDDVITHVNNKEVNSADEVSRIVKENKDKATLTFKVQRNGKLQDVEVRMPRKLKSADL